MTYTYEYDALGNITDIYRGSTHLYYYEYDAMNQLIYVRDYENSKVYTYGYDTAGNLIAENISDVDSNGTAYNTVYKSYQYNDTNWGDKLTSYDGQTITYDAIGNPLSYRDGMTMTWKNGRQLATLQDGDDTISYEYDSNDINGNTVRLYVNGGGNPKKEKCNRTSDGIKLSLVFFIWFVFMRKHM